MVCSRCCSLSSQSIVGADFSAGLGAEAGAESEVTAFALQPLAFFLHHALPQAVARAQHKH